jgi:hypothetical protein
MKYTMAFFAIAASAALAADLPVRQVVLYKHGVGYFERAGRLGPGETARLDFKASEMDDVLKSLTIEAQGDYAAAKAMLERLVVIRPQMQKALDGLRDLPVDIEPLYVTANSIQP